MVSSFSAHYGHKDDISAGGAQLAGACEVLRLAGVHRCSPVTEERRSDRALARGDAATGITAAAGRTAPSPPPFP